MRAAFFIEKFGSEHRPKEGQNIHNAFGLNIQYLQGRTLQMKPFVQILILILVLLIGVPLVLGLVSGKSEKNSDVAEDDIENKIETPATVTVWIEKEGKTEEIDFEEYVTRVVASEMPADFGEEALKAQSVAARTYTMAKIIKYQEKKPESHPDAPICSTTHCQAYKSEEELIACHDAGWEDDGWKKIQKACKATEGELLYYNGELVMQPLFFSSSGGQTENSEDVFSGAYPYLVSVSSPYEEGASHTNEEKEFSLYDVKAALASFYPDRTTGTLTAENIKIKSRTAGGRVDIMQVGASEFKGTEVRSALKLSSALFSVSFKGSGADASIVFTSNGSGHGVGLSQYGARGMAAAGSDYKEILTHYYTGTKVY